MSRAKPRILVGLLLGALLPGCRKELAVVSDLHGDRWEIVNAANGRVRWTYDVDGNNTDACRVVGDQHRFCLVYTSRPRVDGAGHDEIAYTFTPVSDASADVFDLRGRVVGIRPEGTGTTVWALDRLDWSVVDPDQRICRRDPTDPCAPAPDATEDEIRACTLFWPHDFRVLGETTDTVQLVIADTRNNRVVWADARRDGDTCGTVTELLDEDHTDWDLYASINAIDLVDEGTTRTLYMSAKGSVSAPEQHTSADEDERGGQGKIVAWTDDGSGWRQVWEFPPASTVEASFVASPHGLTHDADHVYFAHALGAGAYVNDGTGGSVGVLTRDGGYLYDAVPAEGSLLYTRSVELLDDHRLLVTDSGTKGDEHEPAATALYILELPETDAPSGRDGVWSAPHDRQELRPLAVEATSTPDDAWVLYSAVPLTRRGAEL